MQQAPLSAADTGPCGSVCPHRPRVPHRGERPDKVRAAAAASRGQGQGPPFSSPFLCRRGYCLQLLQKVIKNANINIKLQPHLTKCQNQFAHPEIKNQAAAVCQRPTVMLPVRDMAVSSPAAGVQGRGARGEGKGPPGAEQGARALPALSGGGRRWARARREDSATEHCGREL